MSASPRRPWLDWQRGLAVLFMIEVHALDAWLAPSAPRTALHAVLWMIGGFAAPGFLYMAGMSQALAARAQERRGVAARARLAVALRRGAWVLGAAYAFRLFEYAAGAAWLVPGGWRDLFRVDVLNVIGAGLLLSAPLVALPARARVAVACAAAAAVALATPVVAGWSGGPPWLAPWSYARAPGASFALFPWTAFLFGGVAAGELVAARDRPRAALALGAGLFALGWVADLLPPAYALQDFWHASPAWLSMRLGVVVATSGALQLLAGWSAARAGGDAPRAAAGAWALGAVTTLGRHSLLAYVASVELTYGLASRRLHGALATGELLAAIAGVTAVTWALARLADLRRDRRRSPPPPAAAGPGAAAAA